MWHIEYELFAGANGIILYVCGQVEFRATMKSMDFVIFDLQAYDYSLTLHLPGAKFIQSPIDSPQSSICIDLYLR